MADTLLDELQTRIAEDGPIPLADYMATALMHPQHGYYATRDPFGVAGDFTTAPEISQMFGEMIGLWCAVVWQLIGAPERVHLVELGPGRGTLMADALRAAASAQPFRAALQVHLIEASPTLREVQADTLSGIDVTWHQDLDSLPGGPTIFVANEFFDALPIHQLIAVDGRWHERMITLDPDKALTWTHAKAPSPLSAGLPEHLAQGPRNHRIFELCPAGRDIMRLLSARIMAQGGAALVIDYGHGSSAAGETLQAVRAHAPADPFTTPGDCDLTAHVDFQALAEAAAISGARSFGPIHQGNFLRALGIEARARRLAVANSAKLAPEIASALRRLIAPEEMGTLFKVMAVTEPGGAIPPGFEDSVGHGFAQGDEGG